MGRHPRSSRGTARSASPRVAGTPSGVSLPRTVSAASIVLPCRIPVDDAFVGVGRPADGWSVPQVVRRLGDGPVPRRVSGPRRILRRVRKRPGRPWSGRWRARSGRSLAVAPIPVRAFTWALRSSPWTSCQLPASKLASRRSLPAGRRSSSARTTAARGSSHLLCADGPALGAVGEHHGPPERAEVLSQACARTCPTPVPPGSTNRSTATTPWWQAARRMACPRSAGRSSNSSPSGPPRFLTADPPVR